MAYSIFILIGTFILNIYIYIYIYTYIYILHSTYIYIYIPYWLFPIDYSLYSQVSVLVHRWCQEA